MSNLWCCNCWAVYGDNNSQHPTCPYCNVSHYEETDSSIKLPTRKNFKIYAHNDEKVDENWLPYYILQNLAESIPEIDLQAAHQAGLCLVGKDINKISFVRILAGLEANNVRRRLAKEISVEGLKEELPDETDLEYNLIVSQTVEELRKAWAARRSTKYEVTLDEMLDFSKTIAIESGQLNKYRALRWKLNTLRKILNYDDNNVTISMEENNE